MRRAALLFVSIALLATAAFSGEGNVRRSARRIPGQYIVVLESSADTASVASTVRNLKGAKIRHTYAKGVKGFAVDISDADAQALARDSRVQFVEEDSTVSASAANWGLDRVDQRSLPLNGTYVSDATGAGVNAYIVDTGILASHSEFGGRVAAGFSAFDDNVGTSDCNGHGTHVAGIVGGATYGVAKSATLVPVRVLDCMGAGSTSSVLAGLDWVMQDYAASARPAVVNMSLGGDTSTVLDAQVNRLLAAGLTTVVAAGNSGQDACQVSPARVSGALTVGASTDTDQRTTFSNYGTCVDLFAPGANIVSAFYSSPTAAAVTSGTSAAAPFVAGVAALALEKYPSASPSTVSQTVLSQATVDVLSSVGDGSPNRLLYSLVGSVEEAQGDSQLLGDPGFEYGTTFWTLDICTIVNPGGCPPTFDIILENHASRSGNGHAAIGGPAKTFHVISEKVTIPSTVRKAELSAYLWVVTNRKKPSADDILKIEILNGAGAVLETLGTYSNLDANPTYLQRRFDVTRFRGATIRISFTGIQTQGPPTWFLLDDVTLNIWR